MIIILYNAYVIWEWGQLNHGPACRASIANCFRITHWLHTCNVHNDNIIYIIMYINIIVKAHELKSIKEYEGACKFYHLEQWYTTLNSISTFVSISPFSLSLQ